MKKVLWGSSCHRNSRWYSRFWMWKNNNLYYYPLTNPLRLEGGYLTEEGLKKYPCFIFEKIKI